MTAYSLNKPAQLQLKQEETAGYIVEQTGTFTGETGRESRVVE